MVVIKNLSNIISRNVSICKNLFHMLYMEPLIFALVFAHSLSGIVMRNEVMYQACTAVFNYNSSVCKQLSTNNNENEYIKSIETEIQPYVANLFMMRTILESIVPAICGIFVGAWSDQYGRKPLLVVSMIGFSFTYIIAAVICEMSKYYVINPWYYILSAVPHSLLGGNCVFAVAAFCFITDITNNDERPYRMIFIEAFLFIGMTSGSILSSYVYAATGATITFTISSIFLCSSTLFVIFWVPESLNYKKPESANDIEISKTKSDDKEIIKNENNKSNDQQDDVPKESKSQNQSSIFSWTLVKDMFLTCIKPRDCYDRSIVWLITGTMFISIFVLDGTMMVFYLYVREKFQWSVREFTFFETFSHITPMFGALIGFILLRKLFKMSVVTIAIFAFASEICSNVIKGIASESWHLYLSIVVGSLRSVGGPMCHTIISNIVPTTDMGKIFSIKNIFQSFAPFVAAPLYTLIYKETLTTFPGLFNIISAALHFVGLIFMIVVFRIKYLHKEYYAKLLK